MPSTVRMMYGDDRCFVCGLTGHFACHILDSQCYGCNEFGHFAQDCPNKIPPSETPSHQDRSHSRHQYTSIRRNRSYSTYYGARHGRHFSQSQSHYHSHHDRSSSFRRDTLNSSSHHHSSSCHSLANICPHHHSHQDPNWHSYTPSHTLHFSHRHHSFHSTNWSQSPCSNSLHTAQKTQPRKAKLHPWPSTPINPTIPRTSPSSIPLHILHQIQTVTLTL